MAFSEIELKTIEKLVGGLCREKAPAKFKDRLRFTYEVDGHSVVVYEERPYYNNLAEWSKMGVAKFRYYRSKKHWKLYWMRRDLKWHSYDPDVSTAKSLEPLVKVVAVDKRGAFFG